MELLYKILKKILHEIFIKLFRFPFIKIVPCLPVTISNCVHCSNNLFNSVLSFLYSLHTKVNIMPVPVLLYVKHLSNKELHRPIHWILYSLQNTVEKNHHYNVHTAHVSNAICSVPWMPYIIALHASSEYFSRTRSYLLKENEYWNWNIH